MHKTIWNHRHAATLALVALLAGCGGGGGGGGSAVPCTANCVSGQVTDGSGGGVSGVYVTATNPATGQTCATSTGTTSSAGAYELSASNCGGSSVIVSAPVGGGTVVNSCTVGQACNLSPSTTTSTAPYAGTWTANYATNGTNGGGDYGTCTVIVNTNGKIVDANGNVVTNTSASNCSSHVSASGNFTLSGSLDATGNFTGSTSSGATYIGAFNAARHSASGSWTNQKAGSSGTWAATLP